MIPGCCGRLKYESVTWDMPFVAMESENATMNRRRLPNSWPTILDTALVHLPVGPIIESLFLSVHLRSTSRI